MDYLVKLFKHVLIAASILFCCATYAAIPNNDHPQTFLGPILKGSTTNSIADFAAFSAAGEAGPKNYRVGGTFGWNIANAQRVKVSGEYLWQNITYAFFDGNTNQWMQQGTVGIDYQYDLYNSDLLPQLELNAYFSHAPSKDIGTDVGTFTNSAGLPQLFVDEKRIAGSNAEGVSPGIIVEPWRGTKTGIELNYDYVRYSTDYTSNQNAKGFGGTLFVKQLITDNLEMNVLAAVRQPYNNYQANLTCTNIPYYGTWSFDINGAYTIGKNTLPNTYNVGISANYFMDELPMSGSSSSFASDTFLGWVAKPAVYMPQVLAIVDEKVTSCALPYLVGTIPNPLISPTGNFQIDASIYFGGPNLTYSMTMLAPPTTGSVTISPTTGVITIAGITDGALLNITITATNSCGSVSRSTILDVLA